MLWCRYTAFTLIDKSNYVWYMKHVRLGVSNYQILHKQMQISKYNFSFNGIVILYQNDFKQSKMRWKILIHINITLFVYLHYNGISVFQRGSSKEVKVNQWYASFQVLDGNVTRAYSMGTWIFFFRGLKINFKRNHWSR